MKIARQTFNKSERLRNIKIIEGLRGHTSGLAVPHFVIDLPFGGGKVPLQPNYVLAQDGGELLIRNYKHNLFRFRNPRPGNAGVVNTPAEVLYQPEEERDADRVIV